MSATANGNRMVLAALACCIPYQAAEKRLMRRLVDLALQQALQELGFVPPGPIDGVYGHDTRAGILAWQNARGLAATGLIGDADARTIDGEVISKRLPDRVGPPALFPGTEEIALRNNGGVYVVPVRINGAITLDFIVDSGASDVLIPADVAMTLAKGVTRAPRDPSCGFYPTCLICRRRPNIAAGETLIQGRLLRGGRKGSTTAARG